MNLDPRFIRSQTKLHAAILELAAESAPDAITVTRLADQAGVHRSTVYEHADSPSQLLRAALKEQLNALHEEHSVTRNPDASPLHSVIKTLEYLDDNVAIFHRMNDENGTVIFDTLSSHFAEEMIAIADRMDSIHIPESKIDIPRDQERYLIVRAICDSLVRVQAQWLTLESPRDPYAAFELMKLITPTWWPWASID